MNKQKLNFPNNFLSNLAAAEIAFNNNSKMYFAGRDYDVQFETMKNKSTGKEMVAARAMLDGYAIAATPWQDTEDAHLSAVFALRHALASSGRTFFKPQAGDIARLVLNGGRVKDAIITGFADDDRSVVTIATDGQKPFLDDVTLIVREALVSEIQSFRLRHSGYFQPLNVWKYRYTETPGTEVDYLVSKPLWMVY